jgi:putative DNA primase/helicase
MSQGFIAFAALHGVEIKRLDDSGKIKRCGTTEHPHSTNGAYVFDGCGGWVWAWDGEGRAIAYNDPDAKPLTAEDRARLDAKRQVYRDERAQLQRTAAEWGARMLSLAKPGEHGYLQRKGLKEVPGLVLPEGELFVPMRDVATNALLGGQIIQWLPEERRWEKKYLYGMRTKGAVLRLGARHTAETVLCEGYATGLSIEAAVRQMKLNAAVLVCFSDHNLKVAAERTTGRRYVVADNDPIQTDPVKFKQNPGEQGQRAAAATGLGWAMADEPGLDANDVHAKRGLMAVCALVMAARRAEPVNPWAERAEAMAVP